MKNLIFDSGPVISLTMNNLLWMLRDLKDQFEGSFLITDSVKKELVERPLNIKKFEYEALQIERLVEDKIFNIYDKSVKQKSELLSLANNSYSSKGENLKLIQDAEIETLALACNLGNCVAVVDERTVRLLLEDPGDLRSLLEHRMNSKIQMNEENIESFRKKLETVKVIRSAELIGVAFHLGLFDHLIPNIENARERVLDAVLWGVKTNGCAISPNEINQMKNILLK